VSTPVLICDDAGFARKQLARVLPGSWDVSLSYASNGREAIEAIRAGKGDILFLDLNMPEMDGYQVLQAIRAEDLPTVVIVVSGDIQPEAHRRVTKLGALAFLKKPVSPEQIGDVLAQYGIHQPEDARGREVDLQVDLLDGYQEVANIAMGRAADSLACLLNTFVLLATPRVRVIGPEELAQALERLVSEEHFSSVCQGFIGPGLAGEAVVAFRESSFEDIAALVSYDGGIDPSVELELLMDLANVLISACLKGMADQLDVQYSQGHPVVLGRHVRVRDLLHGAASRWKKSLAIEMGYRIENRRISCDMLLLLTEDSLELLGQRLALIID
jgi:CheY-like chemotaxis protein